jgi:predicted transcriptional regulator
MACSDECGCELSKADLELIEKAERERRRYEIARDVLASWHTEWSGKPTVESACNVAVKWADALLDALESK